MSSIVISGDTSGAVTVSAPAIAGSNTLTLQAATATNAVNTLSTAVSVSGTSVEFTSIPSWVKRMTVLFVGVSTNSTNVYQVQLGSGSYTISGYAGGFVTFGGTAANMSTGFSIANNVLAANLHHGAILITNVTGNTWSEFGNIAHSSASNILTASAGSIALGGTLDRLRIIASSTGNPADTFDAGTINLLLEG
jgi:hypothetical protein